MLIQKISLPLSLLLLAGCTELTHRLNSNTGNYTEPYAQSDFDGLLAFGAIMAQIPPPARAETCRTLLQRQQESPRIGFQLHLMVGRLLSDACGDIPEILAGLNAIPTNQLSDERLQKLVFTHTETLKRMESLTETLKRRENLSDCRAKKITSLRGKQKSTQSLIETKEPTWSKNDEARLLREKLEAIRSMEKQLDENSDGN